VKWINHEIVTGVFVYAFTGGNAVCAAASLVGSLIPDALEGHVPLDLRGIARWMRSHRMISHWFVPYALAALVAFTWGLATEQSAITFTNIVFSGGKARGRLLIVTDFLLLGALCHIGEDALCGTVPSFNPKKRTGVRLFCVGSVHEHLITGAVAAVFAFFRLRGVVW
jgi:inner membrane protein